MVDKRDIHCAMEPGTARAVVYRFLARCFSYPDKELLDLFDRTRIEEFLQSWHLLGMDENEEIAGVSRWLEEWCSPEKALPELEKEYTRLFIAAYPNKVVAPPYSSVYLGDSRQVWGASTAQVARLYEAAGLGMNENFHDIPDHIAAELEFASYLILEQQEHNRTEADRTRELASIEREFLAEHLCKWGPLFLSRVAEYSKVDFYRVIARLAQKFIDYECKQAQTLNNRCLGPMG
jgi:DMSO reductase family type II enzyme chaperone